MQSVKRTLKKKLLMTSLGVTKLFSRTDPNLPVKWYSLYDSLRVSSEVVHARLAVMDEEVQQEYREREKQIERRLGRTKLYDDEEIQELQQKIDSIRIEN